MHLQGRQFPRGRARRWGLALWALTTLAACDGKESQTQAQPELSDKTSAALMEPGWQTTGPLTQGRQEHTATLLASGKVLVAGGYKQENELYEPTTGTWMATGKSLAIHNSHTATLLGNGRVLVVGGDECQATKSAEVYEPASGQWSLTGNLLTCRGHHVALKLESGKVLVVGGHDNSDIPLSSAELYDPATGSWTATGSMRAAREDFTATLLASGKVLVAGGTGSAGTLLSSAEVYDPATGSWTATGSMGKARGFHSATLLKSGKVLVTGGGGSDGPQAASAELYDPATGTWTATGAMANPRRYHTATRLASGQVLVTGGYHEYKGIQSTAELYDATTGAWSGTASMKVARYGHTATALAAGVLVAGGVSNQNSASAELYLADAPVPSGPREPRPTPIDTSRFTPISEATDFIYSGPNAIQLEVRPGTIEAHRVAVLRGVVRARGDDTGLEGVRISILGHPEYGHTLTRADGQFDLAVNGGGALTVKYEKDGYLSAQRQVKAGWASYAWLPDVRLIPLDVNAITVKLDGSAAGFQVAQGTASTDADGTRQATVLFPPDTQASMVLPSGELKPLSNLKVRATEYTVGPNGPQAMPGELPPASGYTYAVELSVDEALAADASEVRFSKPVYLYVDNFLNFPVGQLVPSGWYDTKAGVWRPSEDGRILKVLTVAGGLATLDITGDGVADTGSALTALGITDAERQRLGTLFTAGKSFWRAPIPHFTAWDLNWPYDFPPDAEKPEGELEKDEDEEEPDFQCGSIIDCQNQVLGESADVVGTPYQLNYRSNRVPAFRTAQAIKVQLSGDELPASVDAILMEVEVAGQRKLYSFPPARRQSTTYQWDGKDGYGRLVQGVFPLTIRIGYSYRLVYMSAGGGGGGGGGGGPRFAQFAAADISFNQGTRQAALWQTIKTTVGSWIAPTTQLGGWTLDVHHAYDPVGQILYLGNGEQRATGLTASKPILTTVAGDGNFGSTGDGGAARKARLWNPHDVAVAPDGMLYIADTFNNRVRRVGTDGILSTLPGSEEYQPRAVAVGPDGSVYVAYSALHCIRRLQPNGTASTFAGTCGFSSNGSSGDEGPATSARLSYPQGIAVGKEGNLYIADFDNDRVRYVTPEGVIHTLAGKANARGYCGDNGLAAEACLNGPWDVAVGEEGDVYVSDSANHRVRRIGTNGRITTVVGTGADGSLGTSIGEGGPATQALLSVPKGLALDAAGNLYIADHVSRVRRVDVNGIISLYAGRLDTNGYSENGTQAQAGLLDLPTGLAVGQDGSLYVSDEWNHSVRRVGYPSAFLRENEAWVPSTDGSELYVFTQQEGRHLRTVDALSQVVLYEFGYDAEARLTSIKDTNGLITRVERDNTTGRPLALVAPHEQQRTSLEVDANGYLSAIVNPASERVELTHSSEGLLTRLKDARKNVHTYEYTSSGRLKKDSNPAEGFKTLTRTALSDGYKVAVTTALGRTTTYQVQTLSTGGQQRVTKTASGETYTDLKRPDGTTVSTDADGTVMTQVEGPDPLLGLQAPYITTQNIKLPSGLTRTLSRNRSATLLTPGDVFSLEALSDTLSVNGIGSTSTYDAAHRTVTIQSHMGKRATTLLDTKGRVVRREVPGLLPMLYDYDGKGRLKSVTHGSRTSSVTYDSDGFVESYTDPLSRVHHFTYDKAGRMETVTLSGSRTIRYGYDDAGNLVSLTPPGRTAHSFGYTPMNQEQDYLPPALSGVSNVSSTATYNLDGQPTETHYPDGAVFSLTYEDDTTHKTGRLLKTTLTPPAGGRYVSRSRQATYHPGSGYLQSISSSRGPGLSYQYDGPLTTRVSWNGEVSGSVGYGYDTFFRTSSLSINDAPFVSFTYDNDGALIQAGSLTLSNRPDSGLFAGTVMGQLSTTQGYNGYGEVQDLTASIGTSPLFSRHLVRDDAGRIQETHETIQGVGHVYAYTYDVAGRLKEVTEDGVSISFSVYDDNGNRTSSTRLGVTRAAIYDAQDRLLTYGDTSYTYGPNGDLQSKQKGAQRTTYVYDAPGNLLSVALPDGTSVEYVIDAQNRRVGKKLNGVLAQGFLYDGQFRIIAELDGNNQVLSRFVYASLGNAPDYMEKGGAIYRIVSDNMGTPRLVVNASTGSIAQRLDYDAWGNVLVDTNPGFQPFGFAGGLHDRDTGLVRFGSRDYDPDTGRWTTKDSLRFLGGDGNLYAYVSNDPVNACDPTGHFAGPTPAPGTVSTFVGLGRTAARAAPAVISLNWVTGAGLFSAAAGGWIAGTWLNENFLEAPIQDWLWRNFGNDPAPSGGEPTACPVAGKPSSANQMQQEVRRGQAPRDVERVDDPHVPGQEPHVHYTDKTSSNRSGSTHDAHRGSPNPSKKTREWLDSHGWTPPPKK